MLLIILVHGRPNDISLNSKRCQLLTQLFPEYTYYIAHFQTCSMNLKVAQHWWEGGMFSSQKSILFSHCVSPPQKLFIHLAVPVVIWNWLSYANDHPQNMFLCIGECKGRAEIYTRTRALKIFKQKAKNWMIGGNVFICVIIFFKFAASQVTATIQHVPQAHMTALGSSWNVPRKCKNENGEKYNLQNAVSWTDKLVAGERTNWWRG